MREPQHLTSCLASLKLDLPENDLGKLECLIRYYLFCFGQDLELEDAVSIILTNIVEERSKIDSAKHKNAYLPTLCKNAILTASAASRREKDKNLNYSIELQNERRQSEDPGVFARVNELAEIFVQASNDLETKYKSAIDDTICDKILDNGHSALSTLVEQFVSRNVPKSSSYIIAKNILCRVKRKLAN